MPRRVHRGPRFVAAEPLSTELGSRILMPEVLGRVCWIVRTGIGATQQEVADLIHLPPATVSKLELGIVTMAVHHLDALAGAYTILDRGLRGEHVPAWVGWELHRLARVIASGLGERGYTVVWLRPDLVESDVLFVRGTKLVSLMKECWPDEIRNRP